MRKEALGVPMTKPKARKKARKEFVSIGDQFGRLTVVGIESKNGHAIRWSCKCECGKTTVARSDKLIAGVKTRCGCALETLPANAVPLDLHPGYFITRTGEVWSTKRNRAMKLAVQAQVTKEGRKGVYLTNQGETKRVLVARLMCRAFNGPPPVEGLFVLHNDGDPTNDAPENLRWGTHKENCADRTRHGTCAAARNNRATMVKRQRGTVTWNKGRERWIARAQVNYKIHYFGSFATESEARGVLEKRMKEIKANASS